MASIPEVDKIWMDGELVPWAEAKVHVLTHALHYGSGVFEGIRCYKTPAGPGVFRLEEHLKRLHRSSKLYYMPVPYAVDELYDATFATLAANGLDAAYIRPLVFRGYGEMAYSRSTRRWTSSSPRGRGAPTLARRASSTASAPRSAASSLSITPLWPAPPRPRASISTASSPRSR